MALIIDLNNSMIVIPGPPVWLAGDYTNSESDDGNFPGDISTTLPYEEGISCGKKDRDCIGSSQRDAVDLAEVFMLKDDGVPKKVEPFGCDKCRSAMRQ